MPYLEVVLCVYTYGSPSLPWIIEPAFKIQLLFLSQFDGNRAARGLFYTLRPLFNSLLLQRFPWLLVSCAIKAKVLTTSYKPPHVDTHQFVHTAVNVVMWCPITAFGGAERFHFRDPWLGQDFPPGTYPPGLAPHLLPCCLSSPPLWASSHSLPCSACFASGESFI